MNGEQPHETREPMEGRRRPVRHRWRTAVVAGATVTVGFVLAYAWFTRPHVPAAAIPDADAKGTDPAIVDLIRAARLKVVEHPSDAAAWGYLGMAFYAHSFEEKAVACLAQAELLDPREPRWPYLRGMILAEQDTAAGLPCVRRAAELVPRELPVRLRLAEFLFDVRQLEESEAIFRHSLQTDPENARAKLGLARVLSAEGNLEEALRWAAGAAHSLPHARPAQELLAKLYYRTGNKKAAEARMQIMDRLPNEEFAWPDPILAEVMLLRADSEWLNEKAHQLLLTGRPDLYIQALQRLVANHPDDAFLHVQLGRALLDVKAIEPASNVMQDALRRHPEAAEVRYVWGVCVFESGDHKKAAEILQDVTQRKPDYAEAWNGLAHCQRRLGRDKEAIESFRQVLHYEPFFPDAHLGLAELLLGAGRREEAVKHVEAVLDFAPEHPGAQKLRAQLTR